MTPAKVEALYRFGEEYRAKQGNLCALVVDEDGETVATVDGASTVRGDMERAELMAEAGRLRATALDAFATITRLERELHGARHALDESQRARIKQSLQLSAALSRVAELEQERDSIVARVAKAIGCDDHAQAADSVAMCASLVRMERDGAYEYLDGARVEVKRLRARVAELESLARGPVLAIAPDADALCDAALSRPTEPESLTYPHDGDGREVAT